MNAELAPSIPAQLWAFLWSILVAFWDGLRILFGVVWDVVAWVARAVWMVLSLFWAALTEYVFPVLWPPIEPVFGPVVEHFQAHTWQLFPAGYLILVLIGVGFNTVNWFRLPPEEKSERRRLEAEAHAKAEPGRQAKAAKKKAAAAKLQAADDERRAQVQREYDDYYAHQDQQKAYQAANRS